MGGRVVVGDAVVDGAAIVVEAAVVVLVEDELDAPQAARPRTAMSDKDVR